MATKSDIDDDEHLVLVNRVIDLHIAVCDGFDFSSLSTHRAMKTSHTEKESTYLRVLFQVELLTKATSHNLEITLIEFEDLNFLRNGNKVSRPETRSTSRDENTTQNSREE